MVSLTDDSLCSFPSPIAPKMHREFGNTQGFLSRPLFSHFLGLEPRTSRHFAADCNLRLMLRSNRGQQPFYICPALPRTYLLWVKRGSPYGGKSQPRSAAAFTGGVRGGTISAVCPARLPSCLPPQSAPNSREVQGGEARWVSLFQRAAPVLNANYYTLTTVIFTEFGNIKRYFADPFTLSTRNQEMCPENLNGHSFVAYNLQRRSTSAFGTVGKSRMI